MSFLGSVGIGEITAAAFDSAGNLLVSALGGDYYSVTVPGLVPALISTFAFGTVGDIAPDDTFPPLVPVTAPGTGEDFVTRYSLNGGSFTTVTVATNELLGTLPGDLISVTHNSPAGTFDFTEVVGFASIAPNGTPVIMPFAGINLLSGGVLVRTAGGPSPFGGPIVLPPNGISFAFVNKGAFSGMTALIQCAVLSSTAANSIFASTNGLYVTL